MRLLILLPLAVSVAFSIEKPDKCDINYNRCTYYCAEEFTLDKEKREGCELRCKLEKGVCKAVSTTKKVAREVLDYIEGFSKDR
ncbi:MAG: hypothetical protein GXO18_06845 [Aquificae bacterium]|nr:hypothetical protein [Aquificota bacterium]